VQELRHVAIPSNMPTITKKLRFFFYLLATIEMVLISVAWGRVPLR
jgi:hypothetical protein